jgi:hypothetical protein
MELPVHLNKNSDAVLYLDLSQEVIQPPKHIWSSSTDLNLQINGFEVCSFGQARVNEQIRCLTCVKTPRRSLTLNTGRASRRKNSECYNEVQHTCTVPTIASSPCQEFSLHQYNWLTVGRFQLLCFVRSSLCSRKICKLGTLACARR